MKYSDRAALCKNPTAKKLLEIVEAKKSNLCLAADVTKAADLIKLVDDCGPEICVLKTHIDIVEDFSLELITELQRLSDKHNFLIFEDRKFADIGNTMRSQYEQGMYKIASWAQIVNAHPIVGLDALTSLAVAGLPRNNALLLIAELSTAGALTDEQYKKTSVEFADQLSDFAIGFIARGRVSNNPAHLIFTPGVKLEAGGDGQGQQYFTPLTAILGGSDIIIAGRGIYASNNPKQTAAEYRTIAWAAYEKNNQSN